MNEEKESKKTYYCDMCQNVREGEYVKRLVDSPFQLRTHKKLCFVCPYCRPYTKEFNEAELYHDPEDNPYKLK